MLKFTIKPKIIKKEDGTFEFIKPTEVLSYPKFLDTHLLTQNGLLNINTRIIEQFEECFLNIIDGKYVVASFPVYYPDFSKDYEENYFTKTYGISETQYDEIKEKLTNQEDYILGMEILSSKLNECFTGKLNECFKGKLNELTTVIMKENKIQRVIPKISVGNEIKLVESDSSCTITNRYTDEHTDEHTNAKYKKKQMKENKMKQVQHETDIKISIYTNPKNDKYFSVPRI